MTSTHTRRVFGASAATALLCAAVGLSMGTSAIQDGESDIRIGTYEPQAAFQSYHGSQRLNTRMQEMQQQMQEAQQQGDQQRMMELQQQMQQMQNQAVEQFYADVEKTLPDVAEKSEVKLVAVEIAYADSSLGEPKDITSDLVEALNENAGDAGEAEPEPAPSPWE